MPTMRCLSMVSSPRLSGTEQQVLALPVLRRRSPAPASHCIRRLRQGRRFMPAAGTQNVGTTGGRPAGWLCRRDFVLRGTPPGMGTGPVMTVTPIT
jgi:hypothetical protein